MVHLCKNFVQPVIISCKRALAFDQSWGGKARVALVSYLPAPDGSIFSSLSRRWQQQALAHPSLRLKIVTWQGTVSLDVRQALVYLWSLLVKPARANAFERCLFAQAICGQFMNWIHSGLWYGIALTDKCCRLPPDLCLQTYCDSTTISLSITTPTFSIRIYIFFLWD